MRALRTIGIDSIPEIHSLWSAFLKDHPSETEEQLATQFIAGGSSDGNFS